MIKEIKGEAFRKMQLTELDMLVEFDKVCRKYNINYVLFGGSLLGAVRHQGYIPWDDDADIGMLREDYETFKRHKDEMNPNICFFQDHDTDHEYRWGYGKLRRTGSTYVRVGQEHLKCKTGIFVDVFPMDDIPLSIGGQIFQDLHCYCLRKILWSEVAKENTVGFWKIWFTLLSKIPADFAFHGYEKYSKKSRNSSPNRVRCLGFPATGMLYKKNPLNERYGMPKSWFTDRAEYMFEGKKLYSSKDYDTILKYIYGDYMKLPPEDQREPHSPCSEIVFPSEENI
ncbi:LicD family protein [Gemmiger sp.]|uniref:LicD family protein n=1 Tax=Gemmiger sp. TaxID=2049027 RepID=UPI003AB3744D